MTKSITKSEIKDIKQDINSLKDNVVQLTKTLSMNSESRLEDLKATMKENLDVVKDQTSEKYDLVKDAVKEKPAQSIGLAFAAGIAISYLLSRK